QLWALARQRAHVAIQQLVLAELNDVAVRERVVLDPFGAYEHAVRAVQIFDDGLRALRDDLSVVSRDELAADLHVVFGGTPDDRAPQRQHELAYELIVQ